MSEMRQRLWRDLSSSPNSGFFVWDVDEVVGEPIKEDYFIKCRDGSFIMIFCNHFWTEERAVKFAKEYWKDQDLEIIGEF